MDIEKLIEKEAPLGGEHNKSYADALRGAHVVYENMSKGELLENQSVTRKRYATDGPKHNHVAALMVIMELLKEK